MKRDKQALPEGETHKHEPALRLLLLATISRCHGKMALFPRAGSNRHILREI